MKKKLKDLPDLDKGHSFYSLDALVKWKHRKRQLDEEERELGKKRRKNDNVQETPAQES